MVLETGRVFAILFVVAALGCAREQHGMVDNEAANEDKKATGADHLPANNREIKTIEPMAEDPQSEVPETPKTVPCLEELQAKFGPDIIFPVQQLFPNLYETARAAGPDGQAQLKALLSESTCAELRAKE